MVNFDVAAVGVATVTSLQQFVPTPDEFAKVRAFVEKKWKAAGGVAGAAGGTAGTAGTAGAAGAGAGAGAGGRGGGGAVGGGGGGGGLAAIAAAVAAAAARGGAKAAAASADDDGKSVASEPSLPPPSADESPAPSPAPTPTPPPPPTVATKPLDALTSKELSELRVGRAEQYIFALSKIAGLEKRLAALSMVLSAQELHSYVVASTETLQTAVGEVRGSGRLRFILRSFLELNNALLRPVAAKTPATTTDEATAATAATAAAPAAAAPVEGAPQGFGLLQWSKLAQVKCNSGETATTYLVAKLLQRIPESLNLAQDLPTVDEARGVLLGRLAANVKKLDETVALLRELLAAEGAAAATVAAKNLSQALHETQRWAQDAGARHSAALGDFVALVAFFGETSPPVEAEQFFGEVSALCKAIAAAVAAASSKTRRRALATGGAGGAH